MTLRVGGFFLFEKKLKKYFQISFLILCLFLKNNYFCKCAYQYKAHLFICSTFRYELPPLHGEKEHFKYQGTAPHTAQAYPFGI